jgi:hypothetical protein
MDFLFATTYREILILSILLFDLWVGSYPGDKADSVYKW